MKNNFWHQKRSAFVLRIIFLLILTTLVNCGEKSQDKKHSDQIENSNNFYENIKKNLPYRNFNTVKGKLSVQWNPLNPKRGQIKDSSFLYPEHDQSEEKNDLLFKSKASLEAFNLWFKNIKSTSFKSRVDFQYNQTLFNQEQIEDFKRARRNLKKKIIKCLNKDCPPFVGAMVSFNFKTIKKEETGVLGQNKFQYELNECSGTLIENRYFLTNSHCLSAFLKEKIETPELCSLNTLFYFPEFENEGKVLFPHQIVSCKRILYFSNLDGENEPSSGDLNRINYADRLDWALIELDTKDSDNKILDRGGVVFSSLGLLDVETYSLFPIQFKGSRDSVTLNNENILGEIVPVFCTVSSNQFATFSYYSESLSPLGRLSQCSESLIKGNSGSGVFDQKGALVGVFQSFSLSIPEQTEGQFSLIHCMDPFVNRVHESCLINNDIKGRKIFHILMNLIRNIHDLNLEEDFLNDLKKEKNSFPSVSIEWKKNNDETLFIKNNFIEMFFLNLLNELKIKNKINLEKDYEKERKRLSIRYNQALFPIIPHCVHVPQNILDSNLKSIKKIEFKKDFFIRFLNDNFLDYYNRSVLSQNMGNFNSQLSSFKTIWVLNPSENFFKVRRYKSFISESWSSRGEKLKIELNNLLGTDEESWELAVPFCNESGPSFRKEPNKLE